MFSKKGFGGLLIACVVLLLVVTPVLAVNPHFVNASAVVDKSGSLVVSWKEAGLGNNMMIDYEATADATAVYACINGGDNHPKASNKETVSGPVSGYGSFNSGKNGQITASLTLNPPSAGAFACPPGQKLVLAQVEYINVFVTDLTNYLPLPIPGSFLRIFFLV